MVFCFDTQYYIALSSLGFGVLDLVLMLWNPEVFNNGV